MSPYSTCKIASGVCVQYTKNYDKLEKVQQTGWPPRQSGVEEHDIYAQAERTMPLQLEEEEEVHGDGKRGIGHKLKLMKFQFSLGKKFTMKIVKYWNSLPRKVVESLQVFKSQLDMILILLHFNILSRIWG